MANLSAKLFGATIIIVLAVFVQTGAALKCFQCNSLDGGNCADTFDPSKLNDVERTHFLQDCNTIPLSIRKLNFIMRPVCQKLITNTNGIRVFSRNCFFESENVTSDNCKLQQKLHPIVNVEFCESCSTDGCNSGSYLLPLVTLMVLPVLAIFRH